MKKPSPWWRATLPFFILSWLLLVVVVLPLQWFAAGDSRLSRRSGIGRLFYTWNRNLFPEP